MTEGLIKERQGEVEVAIGAQARVAFYTGTCGFDKKVETKRSPQVRLFYLRRERERERERVVPR